MKRGNLIRLCTVVLATCTIVMACNPSGTQPTDSYNRKAMLATVADSIVLPGYNALEQTAALLQASVIRFSISPSLNNLNDAQAAWKSTFKQWQHVTLFDFGPAESLYGFASAELGTFPPSPLKIESYIAANDSTLSNYDRDSRGILGMEYLLFHTSPDSIIQEFSAEPERKTYARAVAQRIYSETSRLLNAWKDSYAAQFASNNGTDAGSSTSLLFNALNVSYEALKNYKLALPMGRRAGQTTAQPTKVEAFYSASSIMSLKEHFATIELVWEKGFSGYLNAVTSGSRVATETRDQFVKIKSVLAQLNESENLAILVQQNDPRLESLFVEMQKLTRFLKSEASSVLGISITYSSGDGD